MEYELCKKLKNKGFPHSDEWVDNGAGFFVDKGELVYKVPTLEELIEACGEDFVWLVRENDKKELGWSALSEKDYPNQPSGKGRTPSEAVANLWLALQDK